MVDFGKVRSNLFSHNLIVANTRFFCTTPPDFPVGESALIGQINKESSQQGAPSVSKGGKVIPCIERGKDSKERDIICPCTNH